MPSSNNPNDITLGGGRASANSVTHTALSTGIPNSQASGSASGVLYGGGPNWHDGTANPASTVEAQLDKIISDLVASAGADRIGFVGHSYIGAGSIQDGIQELIDDLAISLNASAGATRIGAAPVGGYEPREVLNQSNTVNPGGLGDSSELSGTPNVEEVLAATDLMLRRTRSVTATVTDSTNAVRSGDIELEALDGDIWDVLRDQLSGRQGSHLYFKMRADSASYTISQDMNQLFYYPHLVSEVFSNNSGFISDSNVFNWASPVQVADAAGITGIVGIWEGFAFLKGANALDHVSPEQGAQFRMCHFYDDISLDDSNEKESRPTTFTDCAFTRSTANTTSPCFSIRGANNGVNAVFENCVFGGGSGTNTAALLLFNFDPTDTEYDDVPIIFRKCVFNGVGSETAVLLDSASVGTQIHFIDCDFIGDPASTEPVFSNSSNPQVHFDNCRFSGSARLFSSVGGGSVKNCTFYTDVDRGAITQPVVHWTPSGSLNDRGVWLNSHIYFDGAFGTDTSNTVAAINFIMESLTIDGLHVEYLDGATALAQSTLFFDLNTAGADMATDIRNVHLALNHKTVEGPNPSLPQVLNIIGGIPTRVNEHKITNLKVTGIDQGNPAGTGPQGRCVSIGPGVTLSGATLEGEMSTISTTLAHLWDAVIVLNGYATLENVRILNESDNGSGWMPLGNSGTIGVTGDFAKMVNCTVDTDNIDTGLTLSGNKGLVTITNGVGVEVTNCTFYHDPLEQRTIYDATANAVAVRDCRFIGDASNARNFEVISLQSGDYSRVQGNFIQHRADGAGLPRAINVENDTSMVKDNIIERLVGDGGGSLIEHLGANIITTDNLGA